MKFVCAYPKNLPLANGFEFLTRNTRVAFLMEYMDAAADVDGAVLLTADNLAAEVPNTPGNWNCLLLLLFVPVFAQKDDARDDMNTDRMRVVLWLPKYADLKMPV